MKIKSLAQKTSLEIEDSDVLIIEDNQDTKHVTVADLKEYITTASTIDIRKHINETLDKVCAALQDAKYIIQETYTYLTSIWVDDGKGYIKVALKDKLLDKWLSAKELSELINIDEETGISLNGFVGTINYDDVYVEATSYTIESYNANYEIDEENELSMSDAGYISIYCPVTDNNKVAALTYDDIGLSLRTTERYVYEFTINEDCFKNTVTFIEFEARMTNVSEYPIYENYIVKENATVRFTNGILTVDEEPEEDTTFFADIGGLVDE